jgi:beta-barrel assembly-enhancing protease
MPSNDHAPLFDGRFSDGRTAASLRVDVSIRGDQLVIERGGEQPPLSWSLNKIETSEPITGHALDVLLHEPGRGGATVFVAEGAFVRALAQAAPKLTAKAQRWRMLWPGLIVTVGATTIAAIMWFADVSPAHGVAKMLPDKTRVAIGKEVIKSMSSGHATCQDTRGKEALAKLAARLSNATGSKKVFDVAVVDWDMVNAFAAPGEEIILMRGLIEKAESPDEVAGVLAHEMGHGLELHPETSIIRVLGLTAITEFMLGGSGGTLANLGLMLTQLGYSRQAEKQADRQALSILKKAEIDTKGFSDFFRRVAKMTNEKTDKKSGSESDDTFDMLRTHPSPADRLAVIEAQPKYAATPALDVADWKALKRICGEQPAPRRKPAATKQPDVPAKPPAPREAPRTKRAPTESGRDI